MSMTAHFPTGTIVVYDTEFTTWEGAMQRGWSGPNEHRELVQLAAQRVDIETETVLDSFERLARPTINPELSDYFVDLTHITQAQVEAEGIPFAQLLQEFLAWSDGATMYSYSANGGDYSDAQVLDENIRLYHLSVELPWERFGNLYHVFQAGGIDTSQYNSGKLYQAFGLALGGHEHNAMHDVDSLVQSLFALKRL